MKRPPEKTGRKPTTIYTAAVVSDNLFGVEVIAAVVQAQRDLTELATYIGIAYSTLSDWLRGKGKRGASDRDIMGNILKISEFTGLDASRLFALYYFNVEDHPLAQAYYMNYLFLNMSDEDRVYFTSLVRAFRSVTPAMERKEPKAKQYPMEAQAFMRTIRLLGTMRHDVPVTVTLPTLPTPIEGTVDFGFAQRREDGPIQMELSVRGNDTIGTFMVEVTIPLELFQQKSATLVDEGGTGEDE